MKLNSHLSFGTALNLYFNYEAELEFKKALQAAYQRGYPQRRKPPQFNR